MEEVFGSIHGVKNRARDMAIRRCLATNNRSFGHDDVRVVTVKDSQGEIRLIKIGGCTFPTTKLSETIVVS